MNERAMGRDLISIGNGFGLGDSGIHRTRMVIHRFEDEKTFERVSPILKDVNEIYFVSSQEEIDKVLAEEKEFLEAFSFKTSFNERNNLLLNTGINALWNALGGTALADPFNGTYTRIGVGDSTTAAAATQTGLQSTTNTAFQQVASGYPTVGSNQQLVAQSVFGSTAANFAWNEFVVDNGQGNTGTITAINRLVSAQGTKASGQVWTVTMTITIS